MPKEDEHNSQEEGEKLSQKENENDKSEIDGEKEKIKKKMKQVRMRLKKKKKMKKWKKREKENKKNKEELLRETERVYVPPIPFPYRRVEKKLHVHFKKFIEKLSQMGKTSF